MIQIFKITGDSLYPLYKNGQRVVCRKIWEQTKVHQGDVVVFDKADYGLMIKMVKEVSDNTYKVEGTTPHSIDSRNFGLLKHEELRYKVLFKF